MIVKLQEVFSIVFSLSFQDSLSALENPPNILMAA